jgi:uncharacterized protein DUF6542
LRVTRMPATWDGALGLSSGADPARPRMVTTRQSETPESGPSPGGAGTEPYGLEREPHDQDMGSVRSARRIRLTGRGAVLVIFVFCLFGAYVTNASHWNPAVGATYVIGCVMAAWYVKPGQLLVVVVAPPLLFGIAVIAVKAATATGAVLTATTEGTLLTLAGNAPWLFAGTGLALVIAWSRGLPQDIRDLRAGLRGDRGVR